jgi:Family of unknown function (DUF6325)
VLERNANADPDLVEYLIVTVPSVDALKSVTPAIAQLVASAQLRILDLVCLAPTPDGGDELVPLEVDEVTSIAALRYVDGEFGGLLSEGDVQMAALSLPRTGTSLLMLVEDLRLAPLAAAARACGGRILGGERTPRSRVEAALIGARPHVSTKNPDDPVR